MECSFCAKKVEETPAMVAGFRGHICSECVVLAVQIIQESLSQRGKQFQVFIRDARLDEQPLSRLVGGDSVSDMTVGTLLDLYISGGKTTIATMEISNRLDRIKGAMAQAEVQLASLRDEEMSVRRELEKLTHGHGKKQ